MNDGVLLNKYYEMKKDLKCDGSLFLEILNMPHNNKRYSFFEKYSIYSDKDEQEYEKLYKEGTLKKSLVPNTFYLSLMYIYKLEKESLSLISEDIIVSYLETKIFPDVERDQSLSFKEKVALFTLISVRSFKKEHAIDFHNIRVYESFNRIFNEIRLFLSDIGMKEDQKSTMDLKNIFKRFNSLTKKTGNIYKSPGKHKYYLDIYDEDEMKINERKLLHLLKLIFKNNSERCSAEDIRKIEKKMYMIYGNNSHIFNIESESYVEIVTALNKLL